MGIVEIDEYLHKVQSEAPLAPLKPASLRKWFAVDWPTPAHEVIATAPIMTGLQARTVRHLAASWIVNKEENLFIHVPDRGHCVLRDGDQSCSTCRDYSDGYFTTDRHSRTIPIHDDRLANVLRILMKSNEHITIDNIHRSITKMLDRSAINREATYQTLMHTFGVALAAKGYNREEIHRRIGHDPNTEYGLMLYAKDYAKIAARSPWDELKALGTGEFRTK